MSLKTIFFPLAVIITVFLIIWFIFPRWEIVQNKKVELNKQMETLASFEQKKKKIEEGIATHKQNAQDASIIYNALPSEINNDGFIDELFNGAKKKGVLITKFSVSDAELATKDNNKSRKAVIVSDENNSDNELPVMPEVFKVSFSLELVGNYIESRNFVSFMESANRFFTVEGVKMSQSEEGSNVVSTSLNGIAFYKKDNPNLDVGSVIYSKDPTLKSLVDSGLDIDFIDEYKNRIANKDYSFNPIIAGIGKDDLFSKQGATNATEDVELISESEAGPSSDAFLTNESLIAE